jgi:hypothetical protein
MKSRITVVVGSFVMTAACLSISVYGEADPAVAKDATDAVSNVAMEAVEEKMDAKAQADQAMGEELGAVDKSSEEAAGEQAAMAQLMAKTMPSENHRKLDGYVGQWDVTTKYWMAPGMPPQINQGTSEIKWILDGRFLQENFQSVMQMGDEPATFKGFGLTGYDNIKQQYVGIWADTMSTSVIESAGHIDQSTGALVLISHFDDPMTGDPTTMRTVFTIISDTEALMEAFKPLGEQEFKCLEIAYTRQP